MLAGDRLLVRNGNTMVAFRLSLAAGLHPEYGRVPRSDVRLFTGTRFEIEGLWVLAFGTHRHANGKANELFLTEGPTFHPTDQSILTAYLES